MLVLVSFLAGASSSQFVASPGRVTLVAEELAQMVPGVYTVDKAGDVPPAANLSPLRTFWEARKKVIENYVDPIEEENEQDMVTGAIRGMLGALGDPYTAYMTAKEYEDFNAENEGHFDGIGAVLEPWEDEETEETFVAIKNIIPNNPADKAGLRAGDIILRVDGRSIRNVPINGVVRLIRGPRGETVELTVRRGNAVLEEPIPIVRDEVQYPTLSARILEPGVGCLHLQMFNRNALQKMRDGFDELNHGVGLVLQDAEVENAEANEGAETGAEAAEEENKETFVAVEEVVEGMSAEAAGVQKSARILTVNGDPVAKRRAAEVAALLRGEAGSKVTVRIKPREGEERDVELTRGSPIKGLVLDLSDNPGGLLEQAIEVSGLFVEGPVVHIRERGGNESGHAARGRYKFPQELPVVVLINRGSASASEIVAGAIQDSGRGVICGNRSFGKAKVQSILELRDGSAMRITTAKYLTPKKRDIATEGVHPDRAFPEPPKPDEDGFDELVWEEWHDGQLARAVEVLKEEMAKG